MAILEGIGDEKSGETFAESKPLLRDRMRLSWQALKNCPDYIAQHNPHYPYAIRPRLHMQDHVFGLSVEEFAKRVVGQKHVLYFNVIQSMIRDGMLLGMVSNVTKDSLPYLWRAVVYECAQRGPLSQNGNSLEFAQIVLKEMASGKVGQLFFKGTRISAQADKMLLYLPKQTRLLISEGKTAEALDWVDMVFGYHKKNRANQKECLYSRKYRLNPIYIAAEPFMGLEKEMKEFKKITYKHFGRTGLKAISSGVRKEWEELKKYAKEEKRSEENMRRCFGILKKVNRRLVWDFKAPSFAAPSAPENKKAASLADKGSQLYLF